jgi:ABC-type branched-subunit amino acid transport system permease subunit
VLAATSSGDVLVLAVLLGAVAGEATGFVALLCMVVVLVQVHHRWRTILLIPTLYLAACAWEARLSQVPAITRLLLLGAILIVVMAWRPSGLLGARRVEIV